MNWPKAARSSSTCSWSTPSQEMRFRPICLRELKPDGVLAVHVSNLYLDLRPVLAEHGRTLNLHYGFVHADEKDLVNWASDWVLLAPNEKVLDQPAISAHLARGDL